MMSTRNDDDDEETGGGTTSTGNVDNNSGKRKNNNKTIISSSSSLTKLKMLEVSKKATELFESAMIDYPKFECTLRITLTGSIGVALVLWAHEIPNLIPVSQAFVLGLITMILPYTVPHLLCTILLVFPTLIFTFTMAFAGTTAVLGGVLISDGVLCAIYACYCLFMAFLYFGPDYSKTKGNVPTFVALVGMMAISFRPLIIAKGQPSSLKELWTATGVTNPLAVFQNLYIVCGWSMVVVAFVILLPPLRTARSIILTKLIPGALMGSVKMIEACGITTHDDGTTGDGEGEGEGKAKNEEEEESSPQDDENEQRQEKLSKGKDTLAHLQSALEGGNVASYTIFEPRLCKPPVWTILKELVEATDEIVIVAFEIIIIAEENSIQKKDTNVDLNNKYVSKFLHVIKSCAIAVGENSSSDGLQELALELESDELQHHIVVRPGLLLLKATIKFINAYNNPLNDHQHDASFTKDGLKLLFIIFLGPVIPTVKRLLEVLFVLPFRILKIWDTWTVMYCLKIMAGFVILFVMSIYWDAFESFEISKENRFGGLYSGWHIASFAFALLPTREGTVKKGAQRILGTAVGGFLGWAGLIICSGFQFDDTNSSVSPGGLLAYITIISLCVAYWTYPVGLEAYFGSSKEHGYVGLYLLMTLLLITLETYLGVGSRDDLVVNRVVATITGALMAMVVAVVPPTVSGASPDHAKEALRLQKEAFKSFIAAILSNDEGATKNRDTSNNSGDNRDPEGEVEVQYQEKQGGDADEGGVDNKSRSNYGHYDEAKDLIEQAKEKRNLANSLCKNANMFNILPIFNVNPILPIEIDHLGMDEMLIRGIIEYTATQQEQEEEDTNVGEGKPETGLGGGSLRRMDEASRSRFQSILFPLRSDGNGNEDSQKMKEEEGPTTTNIGDETSLLDFIHSNGLDDAGVPTSTWEIISIAAILVQRRLREREISLNSI